MPLPSIISTMLLRSLQGVITAAKADVNIFDYAERQLSRLSTTDITSTTLNALLVDLLSKCGGIDEDAACHAAQLALAVTYMRSRSHANLPVSGTDLSDFWSVLRKALLGPLFLNGRTGRSHQGFLSLPFCALNKDNGDNDEFWRLHVWLPGCPKVDPDFAIHSHQSFGQSWILAGESINTIWHAESTDDAQKASHAVYRLGSHTTLVTGSEEEKQGTTIHNTHKLRIVSKVEREKSLRDGSYSVPANTFHTTDVRDETVLATIFFFDASRGYDRSAGVPLGPASVDQVTQYRNPNGVQIPLLVEAVDMVRRWEGQLDHALGLAKHKDWETVELNLAGAAAAWKEAGQSMQSFAENKEFEGLGKYRNAAEAVHQWAACRRKAAAFYVDGRDHEAEGMLEAAMAACHPFKFIPLVQYCDEGRGVR